MCFFVKDCTIDIQFTAYVDASYVGRWVSASTSTGNKYAHIMEHSRLLKEAFE